MIRSSRATVLAEGCQTTYLRAGTGPTVLFLVPVRSDTATAAGALVQVLGERFRFIVPEVPGNVCAGLIATPIWIRGLLDGLGVQSVVLLAEASLRAQATSIGLAEPERISGVALVDLSAVEPAALAHAIERLIENAAPA
jgi:hypothetical protein